MNPSLGDLFSSSHPYRSPDIVRVVGFTPKRIIVETIPVLSEYGIEDHNGLHKVDKKWLAAHPVQELKKKTSDTKLARTVNGDNLIFLIITKGEYFFPIDENYQCSSCEY
jgi:hypothetical protein